MIQLDWTSSCLYAAVRSRAPLNSHGFLCGGLQLLQLRLRAGLLSVQSYRETIKNHNKNNVNIQITNGSSQKTSTGSQKVKQTHSCSTSSGRGVTVAVTSVWTPSLKSGRGHRSVFIWSVLIFSVVFFTKLETLTYTYLQTQNTEIVINISKDCLKYKEIKCRHKENRAEITGNLTNHRHQHKMRQWDKAICDTTTKQEVTVKNNLGVSSCILMSINRILTLQRNFTSLWSSQSEQSRPGLVWNLRGSEIVTVLGTAV